MYGLGLGICIRGYVINVFHTTLFRFDDQRLLCKQEKPGLWLFFIFHFQCCVFQKTNTGSALSHVKPLPMMPASPMGTGSSLIGSPCDTAPC